MYVRVYEHLRMSVSLPSSLSLSLAITQRSPSLRFLSQRVLPPPQPQAIAMMVAVSTGALWCETKPTSGINDVASRVLLFDVWMVIPDQSLFAGVWTMFPQHQTRVLKIFRKLW